MLPYFLLFVASCAAANTRSTICTVPSKYAASNGTADDSPAIQQALATCSQDAVIRFTLGTDYNVLTPISATNLSNVEIRMEGNMHLPTNVTYIQ